MTRAKRLLASAGIVGAMTLGAPAVSGAATAAPVSSSIQVATYSLGAPPVLRPGRGPVDVTIGTIE